MSLFSTLALSLLISFLFANQVTTIQESFIQNPNTRVKITNALTSKNQLTVHCKSCDDDLGVHKLTPWASYDFSFRPNLWGTTLFYCFFQWPSSFYYFNVYIEKRDIDNCESSLCSCHVSEKNVCMFNYKTDNYDIFYNWSSKKSIYPSIWKSDFNIEINKYFLYVVYVGFFLKSLIWLVRVKYKRC